MATELEGFSLDGTDKDVDYGKVLVFINENRLHQVGITANKIRKRLEAEGKLKNLDAEEKEKKEETEKPNRLGNLFKLYSRTIALTKKKPDPKGDKEEEKKEDDQTKAKDNDHASTPDKQDTSDKSGTSAEISTPSKSDATPQQNSPKVEEDKLSISEDSKIGDTSSKPSFKTIGNLFRFFGRTKTQASDPSDEAQEENAEEPSDDKTAGKTNPVPDENTSKGDKSLEAEPNKVSGKDEKEKQSPLEEKTKKEEPAAPSRKTSKVDTTGPPEKTDKKTSPDEKSPEDKPRKDSKIGDPVKEKDRQSNLDEKTEEKSDNKPLVKDSGKEDNDIKIPKTIDEVKDMGKKLNSFAGFDDMARKGSHVEEFIPDFDDEELEFPENKSEEKQASAKDSNKEEGTAGKGDDDKNLSISDAKISSNPPDKSEKTDRSPTSPGMDEKEKTSDKSSSGEQPSVATNRKELDRKDSGIQPGDKSSPDVKEATRKDSVRRTSEQKNDNDQIKQNENDKVIKQRSDKEKDVRAAIIPENLDSQKSKEVLKSGNDSKETTNKMSPLDESTDKIGEPTEKDKPSDGSEAKSKEKLDSGLVTENKENLSDGDKGSMDIEIDMSKDSISSEKIDRDLQSKKDDASDVAKLGSDTKKLASQDTPKEGTETTPTEDKARKSKTAIKKDMPEDSVSSEKVDKDLPSKKGEASDITNPGNDTKKLVSQDTPKETTTTEDKARKSITAIKKDMPEDSVSSEKIDKDLPSKKGEASDITKLGGDTKKPASQDTPKEGTETTPTEDKARKSITAIKKDMPKDSVSSEKIDKDLASKKGEASDITKLGGDTKKPVSQSTPKEDSEITTTGDKAEKSETATDKKLKEDKTSTSITDDLKVSQKTENKSISVDNKKSIIDKDEAEDENKEKSRGSIDNKQDARVKEQTPKQTTLKTDRKGSTVTISDKTVTIGETKKPEQAKSNEKLKDSSKAKPKEPVKAFGSDKIKGSAEKLKSTEKLSDQKNKALEMPSKKARSSDKLGISDSSEKLQDQKTNLISKGQSLPGKTGNKETKAGRPRSVSLKPELQSRRSKSSDKLGMSRSSEKLQEQKLKTSPGKTDGKEMKTGRQRSASLRPDLQTAKKGQLGDKRNLLQPIRKKAPQGKPAKNERGTNEPLLEEEDDDSKEPVDEEPCRRLRKHKTQVIGLEEIDDVLVLKTQPSYTSEEAEVPVKDQSQERNFPETALLKKESKMPPNSSTIESKKKNDSDKKSIGRPSSRDNNASEDGKQLNNKSRSSVGTKARSMSPEKQIIPSGKNANKYSTIDGVAQERDYSSKPRSTKESRELQNINSDVPASDAESSLSEEDWFDTKSYNSSDWYDAKSHISSGDQYQDQDIHIAVPQLPDYGKRQNINSKYVYADPRHAYADQSQVYTDPRHTYIDPRQAYMDPRLAYLDNIDRNYYDNSVRNSRIPVPTKSNGFPPRGNHISENRAGYGFQGLPKDDSSTSTRSRSISPNKSRDDRSPSRILSDVSKRKRPPMRTIVNKPVNVTPKEYSNISFLKMDREQAETLKSIKPAHLKSNSRTPPSRITAYLHHYNNSDYHYDHNGHHDKPSRSEQQLLYLQRPQENSRVKNNSSSAENFRSPPRLDLPSAETMRSGRSPIRGRSDGRYSPQPPASSSPSRYRSRLVVDETRPLSRLSHDGLEGQGQSRGSPPPEPGSLCPQSICRSRCNCLSRSVDDLADLSNSSSILKLTFVPPNRKPMWRI